MNEFFEMGGYAAYVWSSFALTALVLIGNLVAARTKLSHTLRSIVGQLKREERLQKR